MIRIDNDTVYFSSGKTAYANCGIIGLSPELEISEGYDGGIYWPVYGEPRECNLTAADMAELADYMIEQGARFKATLIDADQP